MQVEEKKSYASTGSSSLWKLNAKSKYGIPSCGPVVFFSFPVEFKKKPKKQNHYQKKPQENPRALQKENSYIFLAVFKVPDFMDEVH